MKIIFSVMIGFLSITALGGQKKASREPQSAEQTILCSLINKTGAVSNESAKMEQQADGTGGVAKVAVTQDGFTCTGEGISKFRVKKVLSISMSLPNGETVSNKSNDSASAILQHSSGMDCTCQVF